MACRLQKRMAVRRKLHILRTLTNSKSVKKSSIIMDAILYIYVLKLKLEAIKRDYLRLLLNHIPVPTDVKVEKVERGFLVRVTSQKGRDLLVPILEAFEEMGIHVLQARVSCNYYFAMEAIITEAQGPADVTDLTQVLLKAIEKQSGEGTNTCLEVPVVNNSK